LDRFYILGHSFGAYLSALYALRYSQNIIKLVLADPWGVPEKPQDWEMNVKGWKWKFFLMLSNHIQSPFSIIRGAGPFGYNIFKNFRGDLSEKFIDFFPNDEGKCMLDYIYYSNVQKPSGESAFNALTLPIAWAKNPLINRLGDLDESIPCYFIFGEDTWMSKKAGVTLSQKIKKSEIDFVSSAGHHVYVDNYTEFNFKALTFLLKEDIEPNIWKNSEEIEE